MWHLWYTRSWLICRSDQQTNWKVCLLETRIRSFCSWCFFFYKLESAFHVYISSISSTHKSHQEDLSGRSHGNSCSSSVFNTAVISAGIGAIRQRSTKDQAKSNKFNIATGQRSCSSLSRKIDIARHKSQHYGRLNVSDVTNSMLVASPLRESARNPYQQKQHIYCQGNNINPACTTI